MKHLRVVPLSYPPALTQQSSHLYVYLQKQQGPDAETSEKQFSMTLNCQFGEVTVDGVCMLRKFEEPHRVVIACTALLTPSGTGLLFREKVWMVMSKSASLEPAMPSLSSHATLLQTCFQINVEKRESTTGKHDAYLEDFILHAESEKMRATLLHMQTVLLNELPTIQAEVSLLGTSSLLECQA